MARIWTPDQRLAIDTRDKSLLVSAAAGSGKTATLTQRIIESILDGDNPTDINRILVVTFTKAAVGELRERISDAIKTRLAENPGNARLERQLFLLPSAKIMTIDAFCNDCLKSFPEAAGINPGYRLADEAEIMIAARDIFDGITEAIMRGEVKDICAEDFDTLTDCLVDTKRMADVFDIFRKAHTKLRSTKDGIESFRSMADAYDPSRFSSPDETVFGRYIVKTVRENFCFRHEMFEQLAEELDGEGDAGALYAATARLDAEVCTRVANFTTYSEIKSALEEIKYARLPSVSEEKRTLLMQLYRSARDKEKDRISKERERFFSYSEDAWREAFGVLHPIVMTFYRTLHLFDKALDDFKKKHGIFDYTDIERLTFSALVKDGEPTELALGMREEFSAVYIDEYQDVNDLQDAIFRAISKADNRFAVGDIKQSIYGFRSANPEIFAAAKRAYPSIKDAQNSPAASIFMSTNFRSSKGVIDFVNSVFDKTFSAFGESIDYSPRDRLSVGRESLGDGFDSVPEICILPKAEISYSVSDDEIDEDEETEQLSPAIVAAKIREILDTGCREDGSAVRPSDIAVILRSMKGRSEKYVAALTRLGIPTRTSGKRDFFLNSDVLLALCLLNTIDNPLRDVYLTGLLRSPIFEFTPSELLAIRGEGKKIPFYRALVSFVERNPDFEKGKRFLRQLSAWRERAEGMRTDRLLAALFRETGLLALSAQHGEKNNLIRLYEYARSFERGGFGGLGSFISYINNVIADGEKFDCNIESTEENAVTVISAHSSKGLEYPIVFLADAHRKIQCLEIKETLLIAQGFGTALRHRTPLGLAVVDNPMMNAVAEKMKESNLEEELRILYVALTRARERLYIVGSYSDATEEEYLDRMYLSSANFSRASVRRLSSHLDIILAATGAAPIPPEIFTKGTKEIRELLEKIRSERSSSDRSLDEEAPKNEENIAQKLNTGASVDENLTDRKLTDAIKDKKEDEGLKSELVRRFTYEYHSPYLTELPEKISVSALYPTVLDGTESEEWDARDKTGGKTLPEFVGGDKEAESKRRGIATHVFLQFCDLRRLETDGARAELQRLMNDNFLSKAEAERVRLDEIEAFARSELFERMRSAGKLFREFRFNTFLPAELFSENEARREAVSGKRILVQGVIDCIMENPDGTLSIIDYKTDRLSKEERENGSLAEAKLRRAHETQLYYYSLATKEIFGKEPISREVYSLCLGRCISV